MNKPSTRKQIMNRSNDWDKLCSAIDDLQTCDAAIGEYLSRAPITLGERYLRFYGIAHCIYALQYALKDVCVSLEHPHKVLNHPTLKKLREISNDVRHPSNRKSEYPYQYFSANNPDPFKISLQSVDKAGNSMFQNIKLDEELKTLRTVVGWILRSLLRKLNVSVIGFTEPTPSVSKRIRK